MTEARLPEREPEEQGQGKPPRNIGGVAPESFTPRAPEESSSVLTPASSRVDPLILITPSFLTEVDTVPQYLPQEATVTHIDKPNKIPWQVKAGGVVGGAAALVGGLFGFQKMNSSSEPDAKLVVPIVATAQPETPTPTPEVVNTPEPKTLESQLPYELAPNSKVDYQGKDVKFSFGVDKNVQTRTECVLANGSLRACVGLEKFFLSDKYTRQEFNETRTNEELLGGVNDAFVEFFALNIKEKVPEYKEASLDDIKTLIREKKAPLAPLPGYVGNSSEITTIMIDSTKGVRVHEINDKGRFSPNTGFSYNYRLLEDGSFVMEMYSAPAEQAGAPRVATVPTFHPEAYSIVSTIAAGLAQATYLRTDGPGPLGSQILTRRLQIQNHMMKTSGDIWAGYIEVVPHQDNQTK